MINLLSNEKNKKIIHFLTIPILSAVAVIPYCIYIKFQFNNLESLKEYYSIFINSFPFKIFYFFCYSLIFNLYPLNKKAIILSFLSFLAIFLIWHFLRYISPIEFLYITNTKLNIQAFQRIAITNIFSLVIFFILICLSYNKFIVNDIKGINNFFIFTGNMAIFYLIIHSILLIIYALYIIFLSFIKSHSIYIDEYSFEILILKIPIVIFGLISMIIPFILYILFSVLKKLKNISIYFARGIILIYLFLEFAALLGLISPYLRPYENKWIFIIHNIFLIFTVINLFFIMPNYKAGIFTKSIYLITPIFSALFNIVVLSATIFRIIEYSITETKLIILLINIATLVHLIMISICNIKSFAKAFKYEETMNIGNDKSVLYIYVYGMLACIICFIIPVIFNNL